MEDRCVAVLRPSVCSLLHMSGDKDLWSDVLFLLLRGCCAMLSGSRTPDACMFFPDPSWWTALSTMLPISFTSVDFWSHIRTCILVYACIHMHSFMFMFIYVYTHCRICVHAYTHPDIDVVSACNTMAPLHTSFLIWAI